jgi:hypothetical protein
MHSFSRETVPAAPVQFFRFNYPTAPFLRGFAHAPRVPTNDVDFTPAARGRPVTWDARYPSYSYTLLAQILRRRKLPVIKQNQNYSLKLLLGVTCQTPCFAHNTPPSRPQNLAGYATPLTRSQDHKTTNFTKSQDVSNPGVLLEIPSFWRGISLPQRSMPWNSLSVGPISQDHQATKIPKTTQSLQQRIQRSSLGGGGHLSFYKECVLRSPLGGPNPQDPKVIRS